MPDLPLLLLDIDGPLNPYRAKVVPPGYALHVGGSQLPVIRRTESTAVRWH